MEAVRRFQKKNGGLSVSNEVLLEAEVNKLIDKFLFSGSQNPLRDCNSAMHSRCKASKENTYRHSQQSGKVSEEDLYARICTEQSGSREECCELPEGSNSGSVCCAGSKRGRRNAGLPCETQLRRAESSPSGNMKKEIVMPSGKKPPRPPRHPQVSTHHCSGATGSCMRLSLCASDSMQASKGVNVEGRCRLVTAKRSSSSSSPVWAMLFTLCFALIMLSQGFWSSSAQRLAMVEASNSISSFQYIGQMRKALSVHMLEKTHNVMQFEERKSSGFLQGVGRRDTHPIGAQLRHIFGRKFK